MAQQDYSAITAWVDAAQPQAIAFLRELVRVPTDTPPGNNAPHAERAADLLQAMGYSVERHPVPAGEAQAHGLSSVTNLIVRHRFGDGPVIALNAHGDVVPPGEGWSKPPYAGEIDNGRMFGRGVAVSKSDFATYAFALNALRALQDQGRKFGGTVELHFTYDEEMGGELGPGWLLAQKLTQPDLVICAGFSYAIIAAHNGCLHLEVMVSGRAAHAAIPQTGADALKASVGILNDLYGLEGGYGNQQSAVDGITSPTLTIGRIEGGINTNVVPDKVVFKFDRRMIPEEDPAVVEAALRGLIGQSAATHPGISVQIRRRLLARALKPLPGHEKLVAALQAHGERIFGEPIPVKGSPLYTDARLYAEAGVPLVIYGAGPRSITEANAKRPDENLLLEDLRKATAVVACALADLMPPND